MIQIDKVGFIPKLEYSNYAMQELRIGADRLEEIQKASEGIWVASFNGKPMMVIGVIRSSMLAQPRLWFLLCQSFCSERVNFNLRALKQMLGLLSEKYPKLETFVEKEWKVGERFAKFCGFNSTSRTFCMYGRDFQVWER